MDGPLRLLLPFWLGLATFAADRTILAVGAHCGDMEITAGALLARHAQQGGRVVILHLTLGEGGNPRMSPAAYGAQKRREALAAAKVLGAEALFGPFHDGEIPATQDTARVVAETIRQVRPTHVITHWRHSIHKDHSATHQVVKDAVLLASLEGVVTGSPPHRGIRALYYTENWEDAEAFKPYIYVDVTPVFDDWKKAVSEYEFIRGPISSFPYLDYYEALARVRGAEARKRYAIAFDVDPEAKRRVVDSLP